MPGRKSKFRLTEAKYSSSDGSPGQSSSGREVKRLLKDVLIVGQGRTGVIKPEMLIVVTSSSYLTYS